MTLCNNKGFTLVEVLLALAVIAIALTALLKVTAQNIENTHRIKEKSISHWVATQAISMMQLGLIEINPSQQSTQVTKMLGQRWYWRAKRNTTPLKSVEELIILVSSNESGPFMEEARGFRYTL